MLMPPSRSGELLGHRSQYNLFCFLLPEKINWQWSLTIATKIWWFFVFPLQVSYWIWWGFGKFKPSPWRNSWSWSGRYVNVITAICCWLSEEDVFSLLGYHKRWWDFCYWWRCGSAKSKNNTVGTWNVCMLTWSLLMIVLVALHIYTHGWISLELVQVNFSFWNLLFI